MSLATSTVKWVRARAPAPVTRLAHATRRHVVSERARLRALSGAERLHPSFVIIGATKAGTTALFSYLIKHPLIVSPIDKGIQYFDRRWAQPRDWYFAHFPRTDEAPAGAITGEATSFYMAHPLAAERLARVLPEAKLIAILRDPVARAISHYFHQVRAGTERRPIEEAMFAPESRRLPAMLAAGAPLGPAERQQMRHSYIARGLYADHLEPWLARFDRAQLLILKSETLRHDTQGQVERTLSFLGVPGADMGALPPIYVGRYSAVAPTIETRLREEFAEPNQRLRDLVGDAFTWPAKGAPR